MNSQQLRFWIRLYKYSLALLFVAVPAAFVVGLLWYFVSPILACTILAIIILALPLARLLAKPLGSLFWSNKHYDKPQPRFSIPEARRREGKFEEALEGYATIVAEHPEAAVRAYIEMFTILIVELKDADRADALYLEALDELKKKSDRELLAKVYRDIRSRIVTNRNGIPERPPINTDGMHRSKPRT